MFYIHALRTYILTFFLLGSIFIADTQAQNVYLRPFQEIAYLPTNTVYDIYLSRQDLMWLATDKGLFTFNGKSVRPVPFKQAKQAEITNLQEDTQGRIWGSNFASQILCIQNDTLKPFVELQDIGIFETLNTYSVLDNDLWILCLNSIYKVDITRKKIVFRYSLEHKADKTQKQVNQFIDFVVKPNHILITCLNEMLIQINRKGEHNVEKHFFLFDKEHRVITLDNQLFAIQRQDEEKKAVVYDHYLQGKQLPKIKLGKSTQLYHLVKTDERDIWICSREGGYRWQPFTGQIEPIFEGKNVSDIVRDYQGNYWVATLDEGLFFCPSLVSLVYNPLPWLEKTTERLYSIQYDSDKDLFWLGSSNGNIWAFDLKQNTVRPLEQAYFKHITHIKLKPNSDTLWTTGGLFHKNGNCLIHFKNRSLKDLRMAQNGAILMAQSQMASWLLFSEKQYQWVRQITKKKERKDALFPANLILKNKRSYTVELDEKRKKFWVSYDDNLYEYDFEGNATLIKTPQGEAIAARRMALDKQGRLYIASFSQGILIIDNQKVIHQVNTQNELKTDITRVMKNVNDTIWVGTDEELGYLLPKTYQFVDVFKENALGKINYQDFTVVGDKVFLTSMHKIVALPINRTVVFSKLACLPVKITSTDEHTFSFNMQALSYKYPVQTFLYYRLVGIDNEWKKVQSTESTITYGNLNAGSYTFEFYAFDNVSNNKSFIQKYNFAVPKKWYETYLFYSLLFLLSVGIVYLLFKWWLKQYQRTQKQKEDLLRSQLTALRSQMNPHFLYNVLNTVQGLVYSNQKREASELLGDFSDLMRKVLQYSDALYIPLSHEVEILQLYLSLEKVRFAHELHFEIQTQNLNNLRDLYIPSMLIQPFAENAIKHGLLHKKGSKEMSITFRLTEQQDYLIVIVDDNGIGRKAAAEIRKKQKKQSTGFAMQAIEQRIHLLNSMQKKPITFQVIDKTNHLGLPTGTTVEIQIPITQQIFSHTTTEQHSLSKV